MVWKRPRRPFAGGAGSRRRAPGFECHGSRPAFRGPRNMETDGIMRKEDGLIRHKENGAVRFRYPCRESNPAPSFRRLSKEIFKESDGPAVGHGLGVAPRGGAGRRGGMNPVATWVRAAVSPCRRSAGPSPRVGGTRSAGPRRRPRRAQPARPRRCSRRSRRAARGRHHPTTGRTGWHRR